MTDTDDLRTGAGMRGTNKAIVREAGLDRDREWIIEVATSAGECTFVVPRAMADMVRRGDIVTIAIEIDPPASSRRDPS